MIFSSDHAERLSRLPGLSDAQIEGLRIQIRGARTSADAAAVYAMIKDYAPPNDGRTALSVMEVYARTCAVVARISGLETVDSPDASGGVPTHEEVAALEASMRESTRQYLQALARSA